MFPAAEICLCRTCISFRTSRRFRGFLEFKYLSKFYKSQIIVQMHSIVIAQYFGTRKSLGVFVILEKNLEVPAREFLVHRRCFGFVQKRKPAGVHLKTEDLMC